MFRQTIYLTLLLLLTSCSQTPRDINYGVDMCEFCKMSVVDAKFAAQAVTKKGKIYVFDAIECLIPFTQKQAEKGFSHILVCTYDKPGELIDARTAQYLISENIPSPMGRNLSGYSMEEAAKRVQSEKGGTIYDWENLNDKIFK